MILSKILWFLAAIGPLIFLHEMGHYLVGRWCGIKADVFSIGFGRELLGWTDKRGTRWKLAWLPVGGYVRFAGDMSAAGGDNDEWKSLPQAERDQTFQSKKLWQKALTVAAGPVTNLIVAFLIYLALLASVGTMRSPNVVAAVKDNTAAASLGFKAGDRIVAINDRQMDDFAGIAEYVAMRPDQMMVFDIVRQDKPIKIVGAPRANIQQSRFGTTMKIGVLGIWPSPLEPYKLSWTQIPGEAAKMVWFKLRSTTDGIGQIIMGYHSAKELGGPIMMAELANAVSQMGWVQFVALVAMLSINLGFINLLPVPMLDGGHLFFYGVEAIRRKPVSLEAQEWAFRAGFVLVISLMLFVTINDSVRFGYLGRFAGLIG